MQILPRGPAVAAALGLVVIQVGIGVIMKVAQTGGSYSFSTSGSISISELCKLLLSSALFGRECRQRMARGVGPRRGASADDEYLPLSSADTTAELDDDDPKTSPPDQDAAKTTVPESLDAKAFWRYFRSEVVREKQYGFYLLALGYTLINNSIFVSYYLADPGTIQLVKTGGTLITAVIMVVALKTAISPTQWVAVVIQMFGLILTQYKPGAGTAYPSSTYAVLVAQIFLSASSSVYNQHLLKSSENSLHADNMILYASGTAINLLCHVVVYTCTPNEPAFWHGYGEIGAILVVLSNIFIGLAITLVYKYADAVIKCFATAAATGILLYLSPIIFGAELGSMVQVGTFIVFFASWLYVAFPAPRAPAQTTTTAPASSPRKLPRYAGGVLGLLTVVTVALVAAMAVTIGRDPTETPDPSPEPEAAVHPSPFHDVLAMVRWNSAHAERIPYIEKYKPFFDTVHISMPDMNPDQSVDAFSWTQDQYDGTYTIYHQVSHMMQMALAEKPNIKGLMYFHFDAWLDPLAWNESNWDNMWLAHGDPKWRCMTDVSNDEWWGWGENKHVPAMNASRAVHELGLGFNVVPGELCLGWSDIYYIPRRFFGDYILLADIFKRFDVFHELAIPTMAHIISDTQQQRSGAATLDMITDCWGSCCSDGAKPEDVVSARCGHRLDYLSQDTVDAFYEKLDSQVASLGR